MKVIIVVIAPIMKSSCRVLKRKKCIAKKTPTIKVNSTFDNVVVFRRALIQYAITNEFQYFVEKSEPTRVTTRCSNLECKWRIHASVKQDGITFEVKTFVEAHSCTRSNKGGNKLASQGWIASVIRDKLKSNGDVPIPKLQKWVMKKYNVDVSYMKVFRGKEQAYNEIYGKWDDSFMKINDYKEELLRRNPGSVVDIDFETKSNKKLFLRFFVSLIACSKGFRDGCRPYIALDACHLKGKFNGVLVAATSVDGNNSIFPVAYGVLESENKTSWIWFIDLLKKAIGTPDGLVFSSDMQKGLDVAITQIYSNVEHRECIRHLYSNFKKTFSW
ncbi:putative transposase, MuDR, plant, MULE transposase domain-containing protein [Helianthus anomalus]